jgi:Zn-dependent protease with chaperone function
VTSLFLRLLLWLYLPLLLALCGLMGWLIFLLVQGIVNFTCVLVVAAPLIGLLAGTLLQVLLSLPILLQRPPEVTGIEIGLPAELTAPVFRLVGKIGRKHELRLPDEIRVGADTVAHVYEDSRGQRILVLGGIAIAAFSQTALAGVIAHELAHFTAGDTRLSRRAARRGLLMQLLDLHFHGQLAAALNPLVWIIRLYHLLFRVVWAADSRRQEFAADRLQVEHAGKETAAAALVLLHVTQRLPWVRLSSIAKVHVASNEPMEQIFAEHWRRAQAVTKDEWEEACTKELKRKTEIFDTHPCLRDRLKAMGISPKKAFKLILDQQGPPARDLFPEWKQIEKLLTEELLALYREEYLAKRELAQIILGRPMS